MVHKLVGLNPLGIDLEATPTSQGNIPMGLVVEGIDAAGRAAKYRYVKFVDAVTYVAGHCVGLADADGYDVTNDRDGSQVAGFTFMGVVFQTTVPAEDDYGWVQIGGIANVLAGGANQDAGDPLKLDESTDGAADEATEGTHGNIFGIAMADMTNTANGVVLLMPSGGD